MNLPNLGELDSKFTPEQQAYIKKYAAGLLVAWIGPEIQHLITPTIMDGFEPPKDIFPQYNNYENENQEEEEKNIELMVDASGEVIELLDNWFEEVAKLAGFDDVTKAWEASRDDKANYAKYPVMK